MYGADEQPLRYRNGVLVDRTNAAEVEAFRQYQTEKQSTLLSRPQLRTYMRQKLPCKRLEEMNNDRSWENRTCRCFLFIR